MAKFLPQRLLFCDVLATGISRPPNGRFPNPQAQSKRTSPEQVGPELVRQVGIKFVGKWRYRATGCHTVDTRRLY
jgi:hypothetical protein